MKRSIYFRPKITLALLLSVLIVNLFSIFVLFPRIENLIHGELYDYGLQFSIEWANPIWNNSHLFVNCLGIAMVLIALSAISVAVYAQKHDPFSKAFSALLLTSGAATNIFSLYPLYRLDQVVNNELYFFGLTFSDEWHSSLLLYLLQSGFLVLLASAFAVAAGLAVSVSARRTPNLRSEKLAASLLIIGGTTFLALSIGYDSSILALIGLGTLFWGLILTYIGNKEYVRKILLETSTSSQLAIINKVIQETDYAGNAIFFPPTYFNIPETYRAYIQKDKNSRLPTLRTIYREDPRFFVKFIEKPPAMLITPPGSELVMLFEKKLKTKFSMMNLNDLEANLPKLLVEDLEMVHYFEMTVEKEAIHVKIEESEYGNPNTEEQKTIYFSFLSPLTGAIACVLAIVLNKPVMVMEQKIIPHDEALIIKYHIMQEKEAMTT
jgi:hypothetical protein